MFFSFIFLCTSKYEHGALILENMCCFYIFICKVQTKMKSFKCINSFCLHLCAVDFRPFFFFLFFINQFLSLSACLINEYAMENKLLGVLRTKIKLTEK